MEEMCITIQEAEEQGISMQMVRVCRELRKLAKLDRIELDESMHRSGINKHLFSYIKYCGMDVRSYIKDYLSNLQPFMIERHKDQEKMDSFICVIDNLYRVSLYIKVDKSFGNEIIVSFHENNKRGIAKENNIMPLEESPRLVPVLADSITSRISGSDKYGIKILIQRGMLLLPIDLIAQKCENGAYITDMRYIENPIVDQCNKYLTDLYTSDLELPALDDVEIFSVLHQISFTSYGNTVFSNISLLIDNMAIQKSVVGKKVADFALVTYAKHLVLDQNQVEELVDLMNERYQVRSQANIDIIIERLKVQLYSGIGVEYEPVAENNQDNLLIPHNKKGRR